MYYSHYDTSDNDNNKKIVLSLTEKYVSDWLEKFCRTGLIINHIKFNAGCSKNISTDTEPKGATYQNFSAFLN